MLLRRRRRHGIIRDGPARGRRLESRRLLLGLRLRFRVPGENPHSVAAGAPADPIAEFLGKRVHKPVVNSLGLRLSAFSAGGSHSAWKRLTHRLVTFKGLCLASRSAHFEGAEGAARREEDRGPGGRRHVAELARQLISPDRYLESKASASLETRTRNRLATDARHESIRKTQEWSGGPEGIRTPDPLVANQVLSQLSYRPGATSIHGDGQSQNRQEAALRSSLPPRARRRIPGGTMRQAARSMRL